MLLSVNTITLRHLWIGALVALIVLSSSSVRAKEPTDPLYLQQAYLSYIQAPGAWNTITDARDVVVAVIDAGVDIDHEDLRNNIWQNEDEIPNNGIDDDNNGFIDDVNGWDFIEGAADPRPKFDDGGSSSFAMQHGTIVSGIIGAQGGNGIGVAGVAWNVKIMPLRALNARGTGDIVAIARALNYARQNGADIVNLSLVGTESSSILEIELEQAYKENMLIVAAAGNSGINLNQNPRYPICNKSSRDEDWVLGVTALDLAGRKPGFANYGSDCVDIAAPGINIFSTQFTTHLEPGYNNAYMGGWTGTSVAAPLVTGAAALIKAQNPHITIDEIHALLDARADSIRDVNPLIPDELGGGRINLRRIVSADGAPRGRVSEKTITTGAGPGGGPHVRVFNGAGQLKQQFFAYPADASHGVYVAMGDVAGDDGAEIIVTPGAGAEPLVQVFDTSNRLLNSFLAYEADMDSGLTAAVFDVDADGFNEIITAPLEGGAPHIRIFSSTGLLEREFFAFHAALKSGAYIAVHDIDGDGLGEIVVTPGTAFVPLVRVFSHHGFIEREFYPFDSAEIRELSIAAAPGMIVVGSGPGYRSDLRTFTAFGAPLSSWTAYVEGFMGGVHLDSADVNGDGIYEVLTGPQKGGGPHLRIFEPNGKLITQWMSYNPGFRGGINVGASH